MSAFLLACAAIILVAVAAGLARALRGPGDTERIMSAQLLGAGGIAALLLFGAAADSSAAIDLALTLALLAAFAAIAFVKKGTPLETPPPIDDGAAAVGPPDESSRR
ncbi:MAG: multiple resistance and pH regulation protein F [Burkholderiales bacterium]|jgi:multicomponent Na+:H+ antiporter subunit F|nr:multiple resistance and pH regulation protein F [Burkholderiales bacterium]